VVESFHLRENEKRSESGLKKKKKKKNERMWI
jgi:hypothetical protein